MKNKTFKEIAVPAIMLFVIAAVCTALLAGTNLLTKDKIAEIAVQAENEAKAAVITADSFSDALEITADGKTYTYYKANNSDGTVAGYVIAITTKSYGGDLACMVGISADEKITGVEITEINDTAGLGMKAQNEDFLKQYFGKSAGIKVNKNTSSDTEIKAITGATITSQAVTDAVNEAFNVLSQIKAGVENG